jgi:hypothetical protein
MRRNRTPLVVPGTRLTCAIRGVVKVVGVSQAPVPWPIGELDEKQALIVYRGLLAALQDKHEDAQEIADAFGIGVATVESWRKALSQSSHLKPLVRRKRKWRRWTPDEDALFRTLSPAEVAAKTGRTVEATRMRRLFLRGKRS